ncbi:MAG: hypothetical protein M3342_20680 [Bacteroidota bacterium]|nr:hypothetical protein [Bacteroidota bacterium]
MDIVTGRMCPELGGKPEYLDIAGFNFYYDNQWEHCGPTLPWDKDNRRCSFACLLQDAARRYNIPVMLSETGHFGEDRAKWIKQITDDCIEALESGVDLRGICIYPVLDRPDWDHFTYIPCGIWGYNSKKERFVDDEYLSAVQDCILKINRYLTQKEKSLQKQKVFAIA